MSAIVAEKASFANNDDSPNVSKSINSSGSDADSNASSNVTTGVKSALTDDKGNDNEKVAVDTQPKSLLEPNQLPSTNGTITDKLDKPEERTEKNESCSDAAQQNDAAPSTLPARRASTTSKFKEKRPEPLKLNPNQEIPLDLSVKSAGNVPSGNIFNLAPINNLMGPLETPRIQWQDNDTLLTSAKSRLFSSSTNTSQRAKLSSLIGESPPITPSTPLMDIMFSPSGAAALRSSYEMPHSASLALESPQHPLLISPFELNKLHFLDRSAQSNKPWVNYNSSTRSESKGGPRRSCSTDNLDGFRRNSTHSHTDTRNTLNVTQDDVSKKNLGACSKKNSISPLATKGLTSRANTSTSPTKFSYTNQQIAMNKNDALKSPSSSSNSSINGGKSLTPTSVANATANLLNIHLNSPGGHSSQSPVNSMFDISKLNQQQQPNPHKPTNYPTFDQEPSPLDPLISAVSYCQQQQQQHRSTFPSSSHVNDQSSSGMIHFQQQHASPNSLSSSATLNTPTLISPSQLRAGNMCFLPSPTLSPLSSVFDLPSPFLMFPPTSTHVQQAQHHQRGSTSSNQNDSAKTLKSDSTLSNNFNTRETAASNHNQAAEKVCSGDAPIASSTSASVATRRSCSENDLPVGAMQSGDKHNANDLSQLITTAAQKGSQDNSLSDREGSEDEINMEIDCESVINQNREVPGDRPATVIPQICVSKHDLTDRTKQEKTEPLVHGDLALAALNRTKQREMICKRSLSPKSRWGRANDYRDERHESSSAPPDVYEPRVKAKVKTVGADSCFNLTGGTVAQSSKLQTGSPIAHNNLTSTSQTNINHNAVRRDRSKPYPGTRNLTAVSAQQIHDCISNPNSSSFLSTRSNSAEPAVSMRTNSGKASQQILAANQCESSHDNSVPGGQLYRRPNISSSAHQLPYSSKTDKAQEFSNFNPQHHQHNFNQHQQQQHQSSTSHQSPYQQQRLNYDRRNYHPHAAIQPQHDLNNYQQSSIGGGDLHRLHTTIHGCPPLAPSQAIVTNSNEAISAQNNRYQYNQAQHFPQQGQQTNLPQSFESTFNNLPSYNGYQRQFVPQGLTTSNSVSLLRLAERQAAASTAHNILSNQSEAHGSILRRATMNSMATDGGGVGEQENHHHRQPSSLANDTDALYRQANVLHCSHPLELECRSESRSSCSLDFAGSFDDCGGSRSSHSANSNLTAKKYHCDHCSKSFTRSDMLTRHKRLHSGDRPFQCSECKQEFSRSDHLSTHMRTHTGEKPYKCKLCSYSACRKDMITRHLKVHNRSSYSVEPT